MIFYEGYPRDHGATDMMDSSRLAGMMALCEWPGFKMPNYFLNDQVVRCPVSDIEGDQCRVHLNISRDQLVPLVAGYAYQNIPISLNFRFFTPNGDFLSPSQRDHFRRCQGRKSTWLGRLWLRLDILFSAYVMPLAEPNQLIAMLIIAGPEYVQMWTRHNEQWQESIRKYWSGWRGESELAERLIRYLSCFAEGNGGSYGKSTETEL